jgi:hypothetical protein
MDELTAKAVLVAPPDVGDGLATAIPRSELEEVLGLNETPIELVLDVTRFADGEAADTRSIAVSCERADLEQILRQAAGDDVILTFDREALREAMEADVEAHGIREKVLVLAVAATAAAGGAAAASAEPGAYLGSGAPITETGTTPDDRSFARAEAPSLSPDDRAVPRGTPVPTATPGVSPDDRAVPRGGPEPTLSPDDRAVPRGTPVATPTPGVSPDDRAVPRVSPPTPTPIVSPDDRALPRSPVEAPTGGGTASDPGITWAPSSAETAVLAGAIALAITGAFFVVGGRRRPRPRLG